MSIFKSQIDKLREFPYNVAASGNPQNFSPVSVPLEFTGLTGSLSVMVLSETLIALIITLDGDTEIDQEYAVGIPVPPEIPDVPGKNFGTRVLDNVVPMVCPGAAEIGAVFIHSGADLNVDIHIKAGGVFGGDMPTIIICPMLPVQG